MGRLCVSLPVHEQPLVVFDQLENFRAFLPDDTQIVLHLSRSLGVDPADVAPLLPEGVYVNPRSHESAWGDIAFIHNDNLKFAYASLEPFDHVVLHASNDMYVRPGAEAYISSAVAGTHDLRTSDAMSWAEGAVGHRDPTLRAMVSDAGGDPDAIFAGQVEGSFYDAELFREMLSIIDRHWTPGTGERFPREELFYPTLAHALCPSGPFVTPLLLSDAPVGALPISPAMIAGLIDGTYAENPAPGPATVYDFSQLYAVKRVPRSLHDPLRTYIRALSHATGRRLRTPPPFSARGFIGLALGTDIARDPALLSSWLSTFTADDDATLAILLDPSDEPLATTVIRAARQAGSEAPGAADLILATASPGTFEEAALRYAINVVLLPDDTPSPPPWLDAVPRFSPASASHLRFMMSV
jgi:hypothetical protein